MFKLRNKYKPLIFIFIFVTQVQTPVSLCNVRLCWMVLNCNSSTIWSIPILYLSIPSTDCFLFAKFVVCNFSNRNENIQHMCKLRNIRLNFLVNESAKIAGVVCVYERLCIICEIILRLCYIYKSRNNGHVSIYCFPFVSLAEIWQAYGNGWYDWRLFRDAVLQVLQMKGAKIEIQSEIHRTLMNTFN